MAARQERIQEAPEQVAVSSDAGGRSPVGAVAGAVGTLFTAAAVIGSMIWNAVTADGVLAAAGRQGVDELGKALEAFPQSLHSPEVGTIFSPTQGEIASARSDGESAGMGHSSFYSSYAHSAGSRESWPSEVAKTNHSIDTVQDHSHDHSDGHSM